MSNYSNNHIEPGFKITKKKIFVLVLLLALILISIPTAIWITLISLPKDNSAEFVLLYDGADPDFGIIDYSGIEYFIDGTSYFTDSSGIISFAVNDNEEHIFQIIFGGILYEKVFNTSISEDVLLATKSIDSIVLWDEIFMPALDGAYSEAFDLCYWDGSQWIIIETLFTDATGMIQFNNLVMGLYTLSETGDMDTLLTFVVDQPMTIYTENIIALPDKTTLDIDYLNTVFGTEYPVDLSTVTYALQLYSTVQEAWITIPEELYVALVIDEILGLIVFYEYFELSSNLIRITIGNAWNVDYQFLPNELLEIDLTAKSLEASFTWSSDGAIADGETVSLYFFDGIGWILVDTYITNVEGKVILTECLPMGEYKFEDNIPFFITADDVVKTVTYTVESILGERTELPHLDFICRKWNSSYFLFYVN